MIPKSIDSFLKLGYFLDYNNSTYSYDLTKIDKKKYENSSTNELEKLGVDFFMKAVKKNFSHDSKHVVPISGGLDSRAVLAALLEFTDATNICTYTFGTPGTLDYDIGSNLARKIGTKHTNFPLTEYNYTTEELINISRRIDHQTVLFHHPPIWEIDELFEGHLVWSGYFGDPLVGSHYNKSYPEEINYAKKMFLEKNEYQKEIKLTSNEDYKLMELIDSSEVGNYDITTMEVLDYFNRQLKFVAPHVLMKGFSYKTPFLERELINFFLSVDNQYRENQYLYKKVLLRAFPKLFSYPVKNNLGLPLGASKIHYFSKRVSNKLQRITSRKQSNKNINYLDFNQKIRERSALNKIVKNNIHDLHQRNIIDWLDVREIYENHNEIKGNYGSALLLLTSLEIHLKSLEFYNPK